MAPGHDGPPPTCGESCHYELALDASASRSEEPLVLPLLGSSTSRPARRCVLSVTLPYITAHCLTGLQGNGLMFDPVAPNWPDGEARRSGDRAPAVTSARGGERALEPVAQPGARPPAKELRCGRGIEAGPAHLARALRCKLRLKAERLGDFEHRRLAPRRDVAAAGRVAVAGGEERLDHIADVDEVAALTPVTEHGRRAPVDRRAAVEGDDTRLAARVLARSV